MVKKLNTFWTTSLGVLTSIFLINGCNNIDSNTYLKDQLSELKNRIANRDILNKEVSKADVAWHIDHSLKVINRLFDTLELSDPKDYEWEFNFTRVAVWTSGMIPRGRAQAADAVLPPDSISTQEILNQIEEVNINLDNLSKIDVNANFDHPVFGMLDKNATLTFIEIHTNHHLKIITDILEE